LGHVASGGGAAPGGLRGGAALRVPDPWGQHVPQGVAALATDGPGGRHRRSGVCSPAPGCHSRSVGGAIRGALSRLPANPLVRPAQRPAAAHLAGVPVRAQAAAGDRRLRRALALPGPPAADDGGRPGAVPPGRSSVGAAPPPPGPRQDGLALIHRSPTAPWRPGTPSRGLASAVLSYAFVECAPSGPRHQTPIWRTSTPTRSP